MSQRIAIIDYGMGNLHSVAKAVEHLANPGDQIWVTGDAKLVQQADRVIFPGQGAARDCMAAINQHVRQAVLAAVAAKPFLGICMGLQVLLEHSAENAGTDLLGLITGDVRFFGKQHTATGQVGRVLKIPHMGWNQVQQRGAHPLWTGIPDASRFYFVHSYYVAPKDQSVVVGTTDYGITFTSAIARENLFAVQFHPEKSAEHGLHLLKNFLHWQP